MAAFSISSVAMAEDIPAPAAGPAVHAGDWIYLSNGKPVGRIDYVEHDKSKAPTYAAVIADMQMVHVPISSLTSGPKGLTTSLSIDALRNPK
jgi:hypothetical protein